MEPERTPEEQEWIREENLKDTHALRMAPIRGQALRRLLRDHLGLTYHPSTASGIMALLRLYNYHIFVESDVDGALEPVEL